MIMRCRGYGGLLGNTFFRFIHGQTHMYHFAVLWVSSFWSRIGDGVVVISPTVDSRRVRRVVFVMRLEVAVRVVLIVAIVHSTSLALGDR